MNSTISPKKITAKLLTFHVLSGGYRDLPQAAS
jgi:hypothetical protein